MKATAGAANLEILNLSDSTLVALSGKGNIGYAEELYNPLNFFRCVHHISFFKDDKDVKLENPTIKTHVLKRVRPRIPLIGIITVTIVYLFQIIQIVRRYKVCLIRGRAPYYASLLGLIIGRLFGIPLVVSIGGNHRLANDLEKTYPFDSKFWSEWVEARVLKGADKVICPNQYSRNYVLNIGVSPRKAVVIPLRLKDDIFNFSYKHSSVLVDNGVRLDKPIVLFVGRFTLDKQVDVFIEAIPLISAVCSGVQFVLIGDGPLKPKMEQRVAELGGKQRVFFLGFQPIEVIKYCLNATTVVCIPMSGFVIYEAAAAGKPIVAFDVEWHGEFIKDSQNGLLVENRNCEKLAQAVTRLVNEPKLASRLGRNARKFIDKEYNPQTLAQKEITELLKVIEKKWRRLHTEKS